MLAFLDLAPGLTGYAAGEGDTLPTVGAWEFEPVGEDLGWLLDQLDAYLNILVTRFNPSWMGYESPILIVKRGDKGYTDNLQKIRKLYAMGAYVEFFCRKRGIRCEEASIQALKKELTGNRFADKDEMVAVARRLGVKLPSGPGAKDAADALAGWVIGVRHYAKQFSPRWDKAIHSPHGTMI